LDDCQSNAGLKKLFIEKVSRETGDRKSLSLTFFLTSVIKMNDTFLQGCKNFIVLTQKLIHFGAFNGKEMPLLYRKSQ